MAGLQNKTTYRSALFPTGDGRVKDALQKKATKRATSEVVKETAGLTQSDLTLETLTLAFTRSFLYNKDSSSLYG